MSENERPREFWEYDSENEMDLEDLYDEIVSMNSYQRALRARVNAGVRFRQTYGRPPTQTELGPMPVAADFPGLESEIAGNVAAYAAKQATKAESLAEKRARQVREKVAVNRAKRRAECGLVGVYQSEREDQTWRAHFKPEEGDPNFKKQERRFRHLIDACQWRNAAVEAYYGPGERNDLKCDMTMIYRKYGKYA